MKYELVYYEKGKEQKKDIELLIVPNRFLNYYHELKKKTYGFINKVNEYNNTITDQETGFIKKAKELQKEIKQYENSDIFEYRLMMIKYLYEQNGIEYEGENFWNDNVPPENIIDFIEKASQKDVIKDGSKKKALINYMKTALSLLSQNAGDRST